MLQVNFDAKIWKQGNSLILTIPKEVKEAHALKEGDYIRVFANIVTEEQLKYEEEMRRMRTLFPHQAQGCVIHEKEKVIDLKEVYYRIHETRAGFVSPETPFKELPLHRKFYGMIKRGIILRNARDQNHYGQFSWEDSFIQRNLTATETMELKTDDGRTIIVTDISFEDPVIKPGIPVIENVGFSGNFVEKEDQTKD